MSDAKTLGRKFILKTPDILDLFTLSVRLPLIPQIRIGIYLCFTERVPSGWFL